MLKLTVIGNLGSDAELRKESGQPFVSMSIAHTEKRKDAQGVEHETTQWISATLNGDGGNLLPYLKKGTRVYAYGDVATRLFHSEKDRMMKAGLNLFIRNIELIGASPDAVPRDLYSYDGAAHRIGKYYYSEDVRGEVLVDRSGNQFTVDANGWVSPVQPANNEETQVSSEQQTDATPTEQQSTESEQPESTETVNKTKKTTQKNKNNGESDYQGY